MFTTTVYVQRRPHMRDENLEYLFQLGRSVLDQIFDKEVVDESVTQLTLYFPERYMNTVEERSLYDRLAHFCPNLKNLVITTQSVYIIQCTEAEDLRLLASEEEVNGQLPQESTTGRLWFPNCHGYDFGKLQAMKGSK